LHHYKRRCLFLKARTELVPEDEVEAEPLKLRGLQEKSAADDKIRTGVVQEKNIFPRSQSDF
jgi:hypothetical protein